MFHRVHHHTNSKFFNKQHSLLVLLRSPFWDAALKPGRSSEGIYVSVRILSNIPGPSVGSLVLLPHTHNRNQMNKEFPVKKK